MTRKVGDVAAIPLPGGGFGAVQISGISAGQLWLASPARVTARDPGRWLKLLVSGPEFPTGLDGVRQLHWDVRGEADGWIEANVDNPLRDWVDDDERGGQRACQAYAKALKGIGDPETAGAALRVFVEELNAVEERYGFIDTLRREEAGDAFMELARRAGVDEDTASDWFDDWRDF